MKYILLSTVCSLAVASNNQIDIGPTKLLVPGSLDGLKLSHSQGQFNVSHAGEHKLVHNYNVDKEIRGVDAAKLKALLNQGYIAVNQSTNGDYKLQYNGRLQGGGIWGATIGFWAGKIATHAVVQAGILAVSGVATLVGGPVTGGWVLSTLESSLWVPTEIASNKVAIATGIAGGVVTGPV